jgi:hypothetical protein
MWAGTRSARKKAEWLNQLRFADIARLITMLDYFQSRKIAFSALGALLAHLFLVAGALG